MGNTTLLDAAISNFWSARQLPTRSAGKRLKFVLLGLSQVATVVANHVSTPDAKSIATLASTNSASGANEVGDDVVTWDNVATLATVLQQLTAALHRAGW